MDSLRILLLSNLYPTRYHPTGGVFIDERVTGLREAGAYVRVVPVKPTMFLHHVHDRIHRYQPPPQIVPVAISVRTYLRARRGNATRACRDVADGLTGLVGGGWDVIHAHGCFEIPAGGIAYELSKQLRVPYVITSHGDDINLMNPAHLPYFREFFSHASASFFVSSAMQQRAEELCLESHSSHVTPNGVDLTVFHSDGRTEESARSILYVGSLLPVKGADRLPEVMREVWRRDPGFRLRIVGDGPLRKEMERELDDPRVDFLGFLGRSEIPEEMRRADVLVLPSRREGWPCVIAESLACGTPVVGTDVGGTREAIGDDSRVVSGSPFDPSKLAQSVIDAVENADHQKIAAQARSRSWAALGTKELEYIAEAIQIGRKSPTG